MSKKIIGILAAALFASGVQAQAIKVGEMNSYKVFPAFLEPYKKGWQLALDEINAAGGANGRKIEVISREDGGNPGEAVRVAEELLSDGGNEVTLLVADTGSRTFAAVPVSSA